jgi:hemolysin activation/secretion protein
MWIAGRRGMPRRRERAAIGAPSGASLGSFGPCPTASCHLAYRSSAPVQIVASFLSWRSAGNLRASHCGASAFGAAGRRSSTCLALLAATCTHALARAQAPAPEAAASAPAAAPTGPAFDILEYDVEGNNVLPAEAIEAAVQDHLGPGLRMGDVEAARAALESAYQKAGYLTVGVDIPEQRIEGGVVRLSVLEGQVRAVYVTGSRYHDQGWIRAHVPALRPGVVPDFNAVQQQIAQVSRDDRRIQPVIKPGRLPGTIDIDLQVNDSLPAGGSVELNNQNARGTTPLRMLASGHYDNMHQRDETLTATVQVAPEKPSESEVGIVNYAWPVADGDTLAANVVASNSNVDTLGGTQVLGKGFTAGLRWQHPVALSNGYWTVSAGADYKSLRQRTQFGASGVDTPLRYLPFQLGLYGLWSSGANRVSFNGGGTFAIGQIFRRDVPCPAGNGITEQDQFLCSRQGADGSFGIVRGDLRASHRFSFAEVSMRAGAQFASEPLVNAEQYSLGGAETVRGYFEGEATGDEGAIFSTELSTVDLAGKLGLSDRASNLSLLTFSDMGLTYNIDPAVGEPRHIALLSFGAGTRLALRNGLEGQLDFAWPQKPVPGRPNPDLRVHARAAWTF